MLLFFFLEMLFLCKFIPIIHHAGQLDWRLREKLEIWRLIKHWTVRLFKTTWILEWFKVLLFSLKGMNRCFHKQLRSSGNWSLSRPRNCHGLLAITTTGQDLRVKCFCAGLQQPSASCGSAHSAPKSFAPLAGPSPPIDGSSPQFHLCFCSPH